MFKKLFLLLLTLVVLSGCGMPAAEDMAAITAIVPEETTTAPPAATALPSSTAVALESPAAAPPEPVALTPAPTNTAAPTAVATEPSVQVVSGRTPEGAFFLGDESAPLTIIDYSDFL